jgi:hypothetical protein
MVIGGDRPTMSLRAHEEQGRLLQNKAATNHEYLEAVQQSMEEPSTGS